MKTNAGHVIPVYIQDKTVIEDTGATIDLAQQGWRVMNYPARLSYSATPSDFGALVVQRRRWANGGLIILPSLFRYLFTMRFSMKNLLEGLLRVHYLIMPACISVSMLLMLLYPFDFKRVSSWIYITLPPYLYLVCRDLAQSGYRRVDILKAYSLFVILLPVVLSGVKNSLLQIIYGKRTSFSRTPKVEERTATPAPVLLAIIGLFAWSIITAYKDFTMKHELHAVFAVSNALALGYGMIALIGLKEMAQDLLLSVQPIFTWIRIPRSGQIESAGTLTAVVSAPPLQPSVNQTAAADHNQDAPTPAADLVVSGHMGMPLQRGSAPLLRHRLHSAPVRSAREPGSLSRMSVRRKG